MPRYTRKKGTCELCGRTSGLNKHHLNPYHKRERRKLRNKKLKTEEVAWFCIDCSRQIHAIIPRKTLAKYYNTVAKLKEHSQIKEYIKWVRKKKIQNLHPSMKR